MTDQSVCYNFCMLRYILILFNVLAFTFISCANKEKGVSKKEAEKKPVEVEVFKITQKLVDIEYSSTAYIEPERDVILSSRIAGKVIKIFHDEGEKVKKGDLILKIDDREIKASVERAEAELKVAEANYRNTLSMYERRKPLREKNMISEEELEKLRYSLETYNAQIESIKANIKLLNVQLSYTEIRSPFDGVISDMFVEEGQNIVPQQKVARIVSDRDLLVVFSIPQEYIKGVNTGEYVEVNIEGLGTYRGKVVFISPAADKNRMIKVKAKLLKTSQYVKPGMFATVKVSVGKDYAFKVPERAVLFSGNTSFVWVFEEGYPRKVIVNILSKEGEFLYVKGNLRESDRIIVSNVNKLKEGVRVIVK